MSQVMHKIVTCCIWKYLYALLTKSNGRAWRARTRTQISKNHRTEAVDHFSLNLSPSKWPYLWQLWLWITILFPLQQIPIIHFVCFVLSSRQGWVNKPSPRNRLSKSDWSRIDRLTLVNDPCYWFMRLREVRIKKGRFSLFSPDLCSFTVALL